MFIRQPTFLAPEITYYNTGEGSTKDFYVKVRFLFTSGITHLSLCLAKFKWKITL